MTFVNVEDYHQQAIENWPGVVTAYIDGGSGTEATLRRNREAIADWQLRQRVLTGHKPTALTTRLFGHDISMPIILSPTGFQMVVHPSGELAVSRAAAAMGTVMIVSAAATASLEEVSAAAPGGHRWFQIGLFRDRGIIQDMVQRAEAAGYRALVPMVDTPILARREAEVRAGFGLPPDLIWANLIPYNTGTMAGGTPGQSALSDYIGALWDPEFTWKDIEWLCGLTRLPIVMKGVLDADDAQLALDAGCQGVILSNHGGRQLDCTMAALDVLPEVADRVGSSMTVLIDGGIRYGTDVLKALALGASAACIGRPYLWGLGAAGEEGVLGVLEILRDQLLEAMTLSGCGDVNQIDPSVVRKTRT